MKSLNAVLYSLLLAAGVVLLACLSFLVLRVRQTLEVVEATPAYFSLQLDRQGALARAEAGPRLDRIIDEIRLTRIGAMQQVEEGRHDVVGVAGDYRRMLDGQLRAVNLTLAKETGDLNITLRNVAAPLETTISSASRSARVVEENLPMWLDCNQLAEGGKDCAFNRFQGTSKALEKSAQEIAKALPELTASSIQIADNASAITGDVRAITHEITKPEKWYFRVLKLVAPAGWAVRALK